MWVILFTYSDIMTFLSSQCRVPLLIPMVKKICALLFGNLHLECAFCVCCLSACVVTCTRKDKCLTEFPPKCLFNNSSQLLVCNRQNVSCGMIWMEPLESMLSNEKTFLHEQVIDNHVSQNSTGRTWESIQFFFFVFTELLLHCPFPEASAFSF